ncbi:MAG: TetR/AcrR family transcriptional regulator [Myxococcota bacterium]
MSTPQTDGRTKRAEAQRESRRAHILKTALDVFAAKGYHQTRVSDIIDAAGIARGTFYLYFPSKSAIFHELLDQLLDEVRSTLVGVDTSKDAPPLQDQLFEALMFIVQTVEQHRPLTKIIFREAPGLDDEANRKLREFYRYLHQFMAESLQNGQKLGVIRDLDSEIVASCILGSVKFILEEQVLSGADRAIDSEHLGREVLAYNLRGLLP